MKIPKTLLRHTLRVEPFVGDSGRGPVYGSPVDVPCHLMPSRRVVTDTNGRRINDATTAICQLDAAPVITPQARVTVYGRVVEVVAIDREEWPGGPTPNHLEVTFL
ncbi:hypothetical protein [Pseudonocardia sp. McavD-2-B]|uniref:hypothetical protein n=1 Tax=Pseudonocardia sp. McavD-2-B TaxID=2954499 RepID=UPI002096B2FC|nr:hypothetical protein [Pseudonocardia sp. McavD-2-B]MCO7196898.1 hypothetical protein [Pseudonocardia sp. McavD-2-B]